MSDKVFPPSATASKNAHVASMEQYREIYNRSINDPEGFWTEQAERLVWTEKWKILRKWDSVSYTHLTLPTINSE